MRSHPLQRAKAFVLQYPKVVCSTKAVLCTASEHPLYLSVCTTCAATCTRCAWQPQLPSAVEVCPACCALQHWLLQLPGWQKLRTQPQDRASSQSKTPSSWTTLAESFSSLAATCTPPVLHCKAKRLTWCFVHHHLVLLQMGVDGGSSGQTTARRHCVFERTDSCAAPVFPGRCRQHRCDQGFRSRSHRQLRSAAVAR